ETLVVQDDALTTEGQRGRRQRCICKRQSVEPIVLRIGNHGILSVSGYCVVWPIAAVEPKHGLALHQKPSIQEASRFCAQARSQSASVGIFLNTGLLDLFVTDAYIDQWPGLHQCGLQTLGTSSECRQPAQ